MFIRFCCIGRFELFCAAFLKFEWKLFFDRIALHDFCKLSSMSQKHKFFHDTKWVLGDISKVFGRENEKTMVKTTFINLKNKAVTIMRLMAFYGKLLKYDCIQLEFPLSFLRPKSNSKNECLSIEL